MIRTVLSHLLCVVGLSVGVLASNLSSHAPTTECDCKKAVIVMGTKTVLSRSDCSEFLACVAPYNVVCVTFYASIQHVSDDIYAIFFFEDGSPGSCAGTGFNRLRVPLYLETPQQITIGYELLPDSQCYTDFQAWATAVGYQPPCH